jgi:hypothetical protein
MKMNDKMSALLQRADLHWPLGAKATTGEPPILEFVQGCVLLKTEYELNKHVKLAEFPDKTGLECFINHVHFRFTGTNESLTSCLEYAAALQAVLASAAQDRRFRVIVGINDNDCVVRFHQIRPGESWISEDLEGYKSEAVLVYDVPS